MGMGTLCCCDDIPGCRMQTLFAQPTVAIPVDSFVTVDPEIPGLLFRRRLEIGAKRIFDIPSRSHWIMTLSVGNGEDLAREFSSCSDKFDEIPGILTGGLTPLLLIYSRDGVDSQGRPTVIFDRSPLSVLGNLAPGSELSAPGFDVKATFIDTTDLVNHPSNGVPEFGFDPSLQPEFDGDATVAPNPDIVFSRLPTRTIFQTPGLLLTELRFTKGNDFFIATLPEQEILNVMAFIDDVNRGKEQGDFFINSSFPTCKCISISFSDIGAAAFLIFSTQVDEDNSRLPDFSIDMHGFGPPGACTLFGGLAVSFACTDFNVKITNSGFLRSNDNLGESGEFNFVDGFITSINDFTETIATSNRVSMTDPFSSQATLQINRFRRTTFREPSGILRERFATATFHLDEGWKRDVDLFSPTYGPNDFVLRSYAALNPFPASGSPCNCIIEGVVGSVKEVKVF